MQENHKNTSQIEFFVKLKNIKLSAKQVWLVALKLNNDSEKKEYTQIYTSRAVQVQKTIDILEPIRIDYVFQKLQKIKFEIRYGSSKRDYQIHSEIETSVARIVGSEESTCTLKLTKLYKDRSLITPLITITAETADNFSDKIIMVWQGLNLTNKKCFLSSIKPQIQLCITTVDKKEKIIYKTNQASKRNPIFEQIKLHVNQIESDDPDNKEIKAKLFDNTKYLGEFKFTIKDIFVNKKTLFQFKNSQTSVNYGSIKILHHSIQEAFSHFEYIKAGTEINLVICTDFSQENLPPENPKSLHSLKDPQNNQYQQAIESVGEILLDYDADQKVPMYGFGAQPNMKGLQNSDKNCFPMNGNFKKPEAVGLDGILENYEQCVKQVSFSGPTQLAPVLKEVKFLSKQQNKQNSQKTKYFVLLILTNGVISDTKKTIEYLVDCCKLPLSIIIVGVGDSDFKDMEILDGDNGLKDYMGREISRDIIQFVPFSKFKNDKKLLAEEVLEELPRQMVEYMEQQKLQPAYDSIEQKYFILQKDRIEQWKIEQKEKEKDKKKKKKMVSFNDIKLNFDK